MNDTPNLPVKSQLHAGGSVLALVPQTLDEAYRLADALSRSGLTPYNIKTPEAVMACLLAGAELGFPPFQSLQSFAVINGRPSLYGAAVPALLWSNGFDIEESFEGEDPSFPDTMKAICTITRPGGKTITRSFSVADAKVGKLWGKKGRNGEDTPWITSPKRMIQMRARGHAANDGASDVMRGLPLYEEAQDYATVEQVDTATGGTGMRERLEARARPADVEPAGFNVRQIASETEAAKPARAKRGAKAAQDAPQEPAGGDPAPEVIVDAVVEEIALDAAHAAAEAIDGDDLPEALRERPTETASVQNVEAGPASSASATVASGALPEETSSQTQPEEASPDSEDEVHEGCAAPGQFYFHTDLPEIGGDGRRAAFKDGALFSRLSPRDDLLVYGQHAPLVSQLNDDGAADEGEPAPMSPAFMKFWSDVLACESWLQLKPLYGAFSRTDDFGELDGEERDALHAKIWSVVLVLKRERRDPVDAAQDVTAFNLWRATQAGRDGADAIEGTFRVLKAEPSWARLKPDQQTRVDAQVAAQLKRERGE